MLTETRIETLRRIHNANIQKHALSALTSNVTKLVSDRGDAVTLEISNDTQAYPFPIGVINNKGLKISTKRRLIVVRKTLQEALSRMKLTTLHVYSGIAIEDAVVARLRHYGLDVSKLGVETFSDGSSEILTARTYHLTPSAAKLKLHLLPEELLAAKFISGVYNSRTKLMKLAMTSFDIGTKPNKLRAGLIYWQPSGKPVSVKAKEAISLMIVSSDSDTHSNLNDYLGFQKFIESSNGSTSTTVTETIALGKDESYTFTPTAKNLLLAVCTNDGAKDNLVLEIETAKEI